MNEPAPVADGRRAGFVALIGAPNAGKSTLLNQLVGTKVAIVTPKVQTTRTRILGIAIEGATQLVFVDTPGIFAPRRRLDRAMVHAAWQGALDADRVVVLVDARSPRAEAEAAPVLERLAATGRRAVLALNKVDAVKAKDGLLALADRLHRSGLFEEVYFISALTGEGVAELRAALAAAMPEGPWLYEEDDVTDMPLRLAAAEITREKLFLKLRQEIPYAVTVETESWEERPDGSVRIGQVIYVERDSQKAIVIGRGGQMLKAIGSESRVELEEILERRVHLSVFVKVREGWQDDPERYRVWGLDYDPKA